jgi:hypothetical protein
MLSIKMLVTFVTALIDLQEDRPNEKNVEKYLSLFERLNSTGIRIHLFVSPNYADRVHVSNGVIQTIQLSELTTFQKCPQELPEHRTITKDTRNYLILMNSKVELVKRAIESGKHDSTHFAWIDFGICHVVRNPQKLREINALPDKCMYIPGCVEKSTPEFDRIRWRFCGGFFLGDRQSILDFYSMYEVHFSSLPKLTWEVNVWEYFEFFGWKPDWYKADHDDSIIAVPYHTNVLRVPKDLYLYWYGELSKCYVGGPIERYLSNVVPQSEQVVLMQSDSVSDTEYSKSKDVSPRCIVGGLCTRNFKKDDILLLPLDDETFEHGLLPTMSKYTWVDWNDKKPIAYWRGGTSGYDDVTPRMRVVNKLFEHPNCDVRFTRGASEVTDSRISSSLFAPHRVGIDEHMKYKYIFIIDGNIIASSHQWVFGSGSVPIMVTHPDNEYWFRRFLQPMKNYVSIAYDLSDLEEKIEWLVTHDKEAKEIAENAMYLARTLFSSEFQKAYIDNQIRWILDNRKSNKSIGVAIPCYKYHIPKLTRCLDSIEQQTVKPEKVVVVCSSSEESDIPTYNYSFPLTIVTRLDRRNAAQNRNQAFSLLDTELVSFFDADDVMHPQRIEFLKMFDVDIILHSYSFNDTFTKYSKCNSARNILARAPSGCAYCVTNVHLPIHHAHVTCKRQILDHIQFKEGTEYERKEDAVFCGDVLSMKNIQSIYISNELSYYTYEGATIE